MSLWIEASSTTAKLPVSKTVFELSLFFLLHKVIRSRVVLSGTSLRRSVEASTEGYSVVISQYFLYVMWYLAPQTSKPKDTMFFLCAFPVSLFQEQSHLCGIYECNSTHVAKKS